MSEKFQYAQDVMRGNGGSAFAFFNRRVLGETYQEAFQHAHERQDASAHAGWQLADKMIAEGRLYYIHNFHHSHDECSGYAFQYGGSWVCNTCGKANLLREWWKIKVRKDGNAWHCIGVDFENLQESDNYAFGDTREEAIKNYGDLMKGST